MVKNRLIVAPLSRSLLLYIYTRFHNIIVSKRALRPVRGPVCEGCSPCFLGTRRGFPPYPSLLLYAFRRPPGLSTSILHNLTCIVRSLFIFGAAPLFVCATLRHFSTIFAFFAIFTGGIFFVFFVNFYCFQGLFFGGWAFYLFVRYPAGRW